MKSEPADITSDGTISPYVQEIEYALILSRMINTVKDDPAEIRATILKPRSTGLKRFRYARNRPPSSALRRLSRELRTALPRPSSHRGR